MEFVIVIALLILCWFSWQLYRAKQFNRFKTMINDELKIKVIDGIKNYLTENRSEIFPNNECHQQATIAYWCAYPVRILQWALAHELIDEQWLKERGYYRFSQHLMHIQKDKMHHI